MLSATAAVLRARWRAANKLSPGELASLLPAAWCVTGVCAHALVRLHCTQDRSHWQIFTAEAQGMYSVSTRYDYNVRCITGKRWELQKTSCIISCFAYLYCHIVDLFIPVYAVFKCIYKVLCWKFNRSYLFIFKVVFTEVILFFDPSHPHNQQTGLVLCFLTDPLSLTLPPQ